MKTLNGIELKALQQRHTEDWQCPRCDEFVPATFDLCWNCATLHPELEMQESVPHEAEPNASQSVDVTSSIT